MALWQWIIIAWLGVGFLGGVFEVAWNHGVQKAPMPAVVILPFAAVFCAVIGPVQWIVLAVQIFKAANRAGRQAVPKSPCETCIVCSVGVQDWRHDRAVTAMVASACTLRAIARDGAPSIDEGLCGFHRDMILTMAAAEVEDPIACLASKPPWAEDPIVSAAKEIAASAVHYWAPVPGLAVVDQGTHYICGTAIEASHLGSCNWSRVTCPTCQARRPPEAS